METLRRWTRSHRSLKAGMAILAALALLLNAVAVPTCSRVASAQSPAKAGITIDLVVGDITDPFFTALVNGAKDAASASGVAVQYLPSTLTAADLASKLQTAIATHPAGLAFGDWEPKAENPLTLAAAKSGLPVLAVNAAPLDWATSTGAFAFVGQSDYNAGVLGGQRLAAEGVHHGLCVDQSPGSRNLLDRCDGFAKSMKAAGGDSTVLNIPYTDAQNPTKVDAAIQATLSTNKNIDGVFTLGSSIAVDAVTVVGQMGLKGKVTVGTVDLSTPALKAVASGDLLFIIDQQPYLQGYYAVSILAQQAKYGLHLVGAVSTGPALITKDNVARVIAVNQQYRGIRGAA